MISPLVIGLIVFALLVLLEFSPVIALAWACLAFAITWMVLRLPTPRLGAGRRWRGWR